LAPHRATAAGLSVEPDVFSAPAIVDAVAHQRQPLDVGLSTVTGGKIHDDRADAILSQLALDLPHQGLALLHVDLHRLPVDHLVELGIAVFDVVPFGAARVVLVEILVRIVDAVAREIERDGEIFAVKTRKPLRCVDRLEFAVDIDFLQLVDQNDCRVAKEGQIECCKLRSKWDEAGRQA
jgi:hypothetical protein